MIDTLFNYSDKLSSSNRLATILVTMSHHGVILANKGSPIIHYPAIKVEKIKSAVGSGDSFMGGVIYGMVRGQKMDKSIEYGQRCAAKSV